MDNIFYDAQRQVCLLSSFSSPCKFDSYRKIVCRLQGRISFYMTSYGEEAISFGSASAIRLGRAGQASACSVFVFCWFTPRTVLR